MFMQKVRKNGNSLGVTIPREDAERLGLKEGDTVAIQVNKVRLQIELPSDVRSAAGRAMREHGPDLEYLRDR